MSKPIRLICESCEAGYATDLPACPYCGTAAHLAHTQQLTPLVIDTECYPNYWLLQCLDLSTRVVTAFQLFPDHPLDVAGIRNLLTRHTLVTFNGIKYDMPMITYACSGATNEQLKAASDDIIRKRPDGGSMQPWQFYQAYGLSEPSSLDHIDMFEVAPGRGSLKAYAGKMHSRKLQDLPYDPSMLIDWPERVMLREYCAVDLDDTADLFNTFQTQLELREMIGEEHGIDVRSKSDAQIAEAVMKQILLPAKVYAPTIPAGTEFYYQPPEWLTFQTPLLQRVLAITTGLPFVVNPSGGVSAHRDNHLIDWGDKQVRLDAHGHWVARPKDWQHELICIGDTGYAMGTGGLHSTESRVVWRADERRSLRMPDVSGYYPSLIVRLMICPKQIGPVFIPTYRGWKQSREVFKAAGEKKKSNTYKTFTNGCFGKLLSKYSIFYTPEGGINVTITGQLALFMLIESLELAGISVVSANTDGIVIYADRDLDWLADSIIAWWESVTGFTMETTDASLIAARDVNSYVMLMPDGGVKSKGAFAPPEPGASGWPNPTGQVCVDAVVAYLRDGVPVADTIRACTDVRQFLYVRSVDGSPPSGVYHPNGVIERVTTLRAMREALAGWGTPVEPSIPNDTLRTIYAEAFEQATAGQAGEYLGKVVRWYYGTGSKACITYKGSGNRVPRTEGCRPLMTLPDCLPDDIDYEWYMVEAESLLKDVGLGLEHHQNRRREF